MLWKRSSLQSAQSVFSLLNSLTAICNTLLTVHEWERVLSSKYCTSVKTCFKLAPKDWEQVQSKPDAGANRRKNRLPTWPPVITTCTCSSPSPSLERFRFHWLGVGPGKWYVTTSAGDGLQLSVELLNDALVCACYMSDKRKQWRVIEFIPPAIYWMDT